MQGSEVQQRLFLRWGHPAAVATALAVFGALELDNPSQHLERLLILLAALLASTFLAILAAHRVPLGAVVATSLATAVVLIAAMTAVLHNPDVVAIAYLGPIAFSALMLSGRATAAFVALSVACVLVVTSLASFDVRGATVAIDVMLLVVIGGVVALLGSRANAAQVRLDHERAADVAALHIAESVRASLELDEILRCAVDEVRELTGSSRCVLRLSPRADGWLPLYESYRAGLEPLAFPETPAPIRQLFTRKEPLVVDDRDDVEPDLRDYLASIGTRALLGVQIAWQDRVFAIMGVHDERPRSWEEEGLPLLRRVLPQLGAALAQAELYEQQRATVLQREELIANVSHELRTPLTSTIGFLRTLEREDVELTEGQRELFLLTARREAERLALLVDDLLELARLERGRISLVLQPTDLGDVVRRAAVGLEPENGRAVELALDGDLVVPADDNRLVQVFSNLLSNALRHGGGDVVVTGEARDGRVTVAVCDDGPEIPEDRVADLFVPFTRWGGGADSTGLGLAIARGIVEAHGGSLAYRPPAGDRPHAFVVTLTRDAEVAGHRLR